MCMGLAVPLLSEWCPSPAVIPGPRHKGECCLGMLEGCWVDLHGVAMEPQENRRLENDCWVQLHLEGARLMPLAEYRVGVWVHNELLFLEALHEMGKMQARELSDLAKFSKLVNGRAQVHTKTAYLSMLCTSPCCLWTGGPPGICVRPWPVCTHIVSSPLPHSTLYHRGIGHRLHVIPQTSVSTGF